MTSPLSLSLLVNAIDSVICRMKPGCTLKKNIAKRKGAFDISSVVIDDRIAGLHLFRFQRDAVLIR